MSKSETNKAPNKSPRDMIIRGVVFGGLAILLIVALLDFQAKQAAQSTGDGWRDAVKSKGEDQDVLKSEFSKLSVKGSPQIESREAGENSFAAKTLTTYTWQGIFRSYVVKVYFGLGADPPVDAIEGPGEDQ